MKNVLVKITPRMAEEWLKKNLSNRPLSEITVKRYAEAMAKNEWELNGDAIRFDIEGNLIDGQHRLHACILAKKAFRAYVIRGLPTRAFDTIDQGRPRSIGDVLARRGEKNYLTLASAVRYVYMLDQKTPTKTGKLRPPVADAVLAKHPHIRDSVAFAKSIEKKTQVMSPSQLATMHYLFSRIDKEKNDLFWERVGEGIGLKRGMPELLLRQRLLKNSTSQAKLSEFAIFALCIKTFNCVILAKPLKSLQWQQDKEDFPKLVKPLKIAAAS